ncbi:VanZ family protein [Patescibacteria group bacterium]|nr:VanZ family protein [Patescibacteria group bacterium]
MAKKFLKLWLPIIIWASLIFYLSSIPDLKSGLETFWDTVLRKICHLAEYGIFFLLLARAMKQPLKWVIIISILYALLDEFHQGFVPGRDMALADICFDSAGVLIGYLIWPLTQRR